MTQQPSGWYDDPQDENNLRYWDGVIWTDHIHPKKSAQMDRPRIDLSKSGDPYGRPARGGHQPAPPTGWQQQSVYGRSMTTPDGVALSGWWKRVLARILDSIFVFVLALPFTFYFYGRSISAISDWMGGAIADAEAGRRTTTTMLPAEVAGWLAAAAVITLVVSVVYEVLFLRHRGATPGKMVVGISVRLRDQTGPPPMPAIWRRVGVLYGLQALGSVPVIGGVAGIALLLDYLWPLWDDKNQAWHDKVAGTNVVQGSQRRGAPASTHPYDPHSAPYDQQHQTWRH